MKLSMPFGNLPGLVVIHPCHAETIDFDRAAVGSALPGSTVAMIYQGYPLKGEVNPSNHFIVRANALEDHVALSKVENVGLVIFAPNGSVSNRYGVKCRVPKQTRFPLSVGFRGTVSLHNQELK